MPRLSDLCCLAVLAWPVLAGVQTPDLTLVMERLERLERENRALEERVSALTARLERREAAVEAAPAAAEQSDHRELRSNAYPRPGSMSDPLTTEATPVDVPLDQRVEIQERRINELAQTKVEAAQKFPVRLTGMLLFNSFLNSITP